MIIKFLGLGITMFGCYLIYAKRDRGDDSLLLGSGIIMTGLLMIAVGWIVKIDSKR